MRCPKCGAKIKKGSNICIKCGTKMEEITNASHSQVKKAKQEYQPELVVYSTYFPKDLSYKRTLLLCIFLGYFGAHLYYVKRYFKAIAMTVMMAAFLLCAVPVGFFMQYGDASFFNPLVTFLMTTGLYVIPSALGAICMVMWVMDLIKIITKNFPVPVVLAEKDK